MNDAMKYGLIAVVVLVLVSIGVVLVKQQAPAPQPTPTPAPGQGGTPSPLHCVILADCPPGAARCVNGTCTSTDEHGCVPDGGYQWCEAKQKCLRPWEENCTSEVGGPGIPNPAAAYCTNIGYRLQEGDCVFTSSNCTNESEGESCTGTGETKCEEWAFFHGQCGREFSFCEKDGFTLQNRTEDMGSWSAEYAVCVFPDASECLEQDYLAGTCTESQCGHWSMAAGCTA